MRFGLGSDFGARGRRKARDFGRSGLGPYLGRARRLCRDRLDARARRAGGDDGREREGGAASEHCPDSSSSRARAVLSAAP